MNIIVVGVGTVGYIATESLTKYHNVMVLENDPTKVEEIKNNLNVSVLQEDATSPKILELAIKIHSADVILCTTGKDSDNLFISLVCKHIKPSIKTVARIKDPDYMLSNVTKDGVVDHIITPEIIIGNKIAHLATTENAVDYDLIESMNLAMATFIVKKTHTNLLGKSFVTLNIPSECSIIAVYRNEQIVFEHETLLIREGDVITVLGSESGLNEFNRMMGIDKEARDIVVAGGGVAGTRISSILEAKKLRVKIIEQNLAACKQLSKNFNNALIVNGSCVDPRILSAENVGKSDVLIATTNVDETNLLSCLMALKLGTTKVIAKYTRLEYQDIFDFTGIKTNIGQHRIIANEVIKTLISDEKSIIKMKNPGELFFSITVPVNSKVSNNLIGDITMPEGSRICCIIRNGQNIYPRFDTRILPDDKVLLFTYNSNRRKLEKLFGVEISVVI